jgi:hypothetical protein
MNGLFLSRSAAGAPDAMHSARAIPMMMKNMDFRFISFTSRQEPFWKELWAKRSGAAHCGASVLILPKKIENSTASD